MAAVGLPSPASLGQLIERGPETAFILGILYLAASLYAARRLHLVYRSRRAFDLPALLISSVVFNLLVRLLSFVTLAVLALRNEDIGGGGGDDAGNALWLQHVMAVLLNTGDFTAISTYLLLGVVWVELLQKTRKHFYSHEAIRRDWLIAYVVLNCLLYALQIGLYVAVFAANTANPEVVLSSVYVVLGCLNVLLPLVLLLTYGGYAIAYSGFPYRSREALQRWQRLSRLLIGWSVARFVWAAASLLAASSWALDALAGAGSWAFTVLCVSLFLFAELVPFLATCGTDVLLLFGPLIGVGDGAGKAGGLHASSDEGDGMALGEEEEEEEEEGGGGGSGRREALMGGSSSGDLRMLAAPLEYHDEQYSLRVGGQPVVPLATAGSGAPAAGRPGGRAGGGPPARRTQPIPIHQQPPPPPQPEWHGVGGLLGGRSGSTHSIAASFVSARSFSEDDDAEQGGDARSAGSPRAPAHAAAPPPVPASVAPKQLRFALTPTSTGIR